MKNILSLLICSIFTFCLFACSAPTPSVSSAPAESTAPAESSAATASPAPSAKPTPTVTPTPSPEKVYKDMTVGEITFKIDPEWEVITEEESDDLSMYTIYPFSNLKEGEDETYLQITKLKNDYSPDDDQYAYLSSERQAYEDILKERDYAINDDTLTETEINQIPMLIVQFNNLFGDIDKTYNKIYTFFTKDNIYKVKILCTENNFDAMSALQEELVNSIKISEDAAEPSQSVVDAEPDESADDLSEEEIFRMIDAQLQGIWIRGDADISDVACLILQFYGGKVKFGHPHVKWERLKKGEYTVGLNESEYFTNKYWAYIWIPSEQLGWPVYLNFENNVLSIEGWHKYDGYYIPEQNENISYNDGTIDSYDMGD